MMTFRLALLLAVSIVFANPAFAQKAKPSLYGRWKNIETRVYKADGTIINQAGPECVVAFIKHQVISDCALPDGRKVHVVSKLELLTPTTYESEVVEAGNTQTTVGPRSRSEYRIVGNKLFVTAHPPFVPGSPIVKVEATYIRE